MLTRVISKGRSLLCWYTRVVKDIPQELVATVLKRSTRKVDLTTWPRVKTGRKARLNHPTHPQDVLFQETVFLIGNALINP